jgi:CxC2 like cysteine cluster associated with KDZ transposases
LNVNNFQSQNEFLEDWLPLRTTYLREILELESPPPSQVCQICNQNNFKFRCHDCFHQPVTCSACCAKSHANVPFHSIDAWNGRCFLPSDLLDVGLVIHLGHRGSPCPEYIEGQWEQDTDSEPDPDWTDAHQLQIVHSNGVCRRNIHYCKCSNAPSYHIQLLQHHLFPSSYKKPRTAFTFDVLNHFHIEAMECKTSAGAFYSKLKRLTSNTFPNTVPVSTCYSICCFSHPYKLLGDNRIDIGSY